MSIPKSSSSDEGTVTRTIRKTLFTTANPFEKQFGYHRAVRRGPYICVSGTTAVELVDVGVTEQGANSSPRVRYPDDAFKQAQFAMQRCQEAVEKLGGTTEDIIRVKMFVARFEDCGEVGRAYKAVFGSSDADTQDSIEEDVIGAAATMLVVPGGFVDAAMLVEVEVDAYCS